MIFRVLSRPMLALVLGAAVAGQSLTLAANPSPKRAPTTAATTLATPAVQPALPIRAAFFYPWFPEAWTQLATYPYSHYNPSLGFYDSSSAAVIANQIAAMQYGHIQAGIASWWGQGSKTDTRIPALLAGAAGTSFRWSLYYEREGSGDPTVAQLQSDLAYITTSYTANPAYLRIGGKPVLFVYGDGTDGCAMATRWAQADPTHAFYVVLKVFAGYRTCVDQPANWHQYAPAGAEDSQAGHAFTISPGFYKASEATPRLARSPAAWTQDIADMVASNAPLQLITTFNEWGEGTSVESAVQWATPSGRGTYLDALHANPGYTAGTVTRLAGANRFATAAAISAATFAPGVDVAYIAYAFNYPDALAGAAAAGTIRGPVLLAATSLPLNIATSTELVRLKPKRIVVLGGSGVISEALEVALKAWLGP
jgi:hypothetical protein